MHRVIFFLRQKVLDLRANTYWRFLTSEARGDTSKGLLTKSTAAMRRVGLMDVL